MHQTIYIKQASKLTYSMGYITVFNGDSEVKIFINDISCIIIESTSTIITIPLINELVSHNIALIVCNDKHSPVATVLGMNNNYQASGNLFKQLEWAKEAKESL
jgi:CRISPR/Cas system-associated endonuclease Cas1